MFIRIIRHASFKIKCKNLRYSSFFEIFFMLEKEKGFQAFFESRIAKRIEY